MKALAETHIDILHAAPGLTSRSELQQVCSGLRAENEALRQELRELRAFRALAYRDPLTGLWNRRYFDERLTEEISRARRKLDYTFSLVVVDVNDLKLVNDSDGHSGGDELLQWVASFLGDTTRAHDLVCRLGGDEFGIILPDCNAAQSQVVQSRLRDGLFEQNRFRAPKVGLSLGAATCPDAGLVPTAIVRAADAAMYADKRQQKTGRLLLSVAP